MAEAVIEIILNGETESVPESFSINDLLGQLNVNMRAIAVELNEQIVPKTAFETTQLAPGDQLEIVTLVGGG